MTTDEQFEEIRENAMKLWKIVDIDNNKHRYTTIKIEQIKDIKNISDNFMYIIQMFDIQNQHKLAENLSETTRKVIRQEMKKHKTPEQLIVF